MSLYHCNISLSHNAVSSSAYICGEDLYSERDAKLYHYGKEEVVCHAIMLPEHAPMELQNREVLWNRAEESERQYDGQAVRKFQVSLPNELNYQEAEDCIREFCGKLTAKGMCIEYGIHHNKRTGPMNEDNLHAHILATTRPVDSDGNFTSKRTSLFVVRSADGDEIRCKSTAIPEGYEKVPVLKPGFDDPGRCIFRVKHADGTQTRELFADRASAPEGAVFAGYENQKENSGHRMVWLKTYGHETTWDSRSQLYEWRQEWEISYNDAIDRAADRIERDEGFVPDYVDCRSYEAQAEDVLNDFDTENGKVDWLPRPSYHIGAAHSSEIYSPDFDSWTERQDFYRETFTELSVLKKILNLVNVIANTIEAAYERISDRVDAFFDRLDGFLCHDTDAPDVLDLSEDVASLRRDFSAVVYGDADHIEYEYEDDTVKDDVTYNEYDPADYDPDPVDYDPDPVTWDDGWSCIDAGL